MDVRVEPWRRLSAKELVLLNCGIEKTLETPLDCKKIKIPVNPKGNQPWIFTARTDAEATILWPPDAKSWLFGKNPNAGKEKAGEVDDKGWNGWMASLTQWTWVWASSRRWWRTRKPGVLQSMGLRTVRHDWEAEQQQPPRTSRCWLWPEPSVVIDLSSTSLWCFSLTWHWDRTEET